MRPTPAQERWLRLARRLRRDPRTPLFAAHTGGWRTARLPSRCAFFVLGLVAAAMLGIICDRLGLGGGVVLAGLVSVAFAEWLILKRGYFWSGREEALETAGLAMLGFECWRQFGNAYYSAAGLIGAALAIAGLRLLNPLLTTLAALAGVVALDAGGTGAALVCYGAGLAALGAGARRYARPSHDRMLDFLAVAMPVAGYFALAVQNNLWTPADYRHGGLALWAVPLASLAYAALALGIGLRRRAHAPLIAAMACIACAAYELRSLSGLALETRLIVWGGLLLIAATLIERLLREPRGGITGAALRGEGAASAVLEMAGSVALSAHAEAAGTPAAAPVQGGGGRFGGGGASGNY